MTVDSCRCHHSRNRAIRPSSAISIVKNPASRTRARSERQQDVEFTIERHWVVAPTVLAAWHASYIRRTDLARVRLAGFMTMEIADDGRIARFREWWHRRESTAKG